MLSGALTTLMKSKVQIGDNRPTATVVVGGVTMPGVISISIDRAKGAASSATVSFNNAGGLVAPDGSGTYNHILWPNKVVTISLGYGSSQVLLFTGYVDECRMSTWPQIATITCRDKSKLALDQLIQTTWESELTYRMYYQGQTLEYIFRDLAVNIMGGWATGDVTTGTTGVTLDEIVFNQEFYSDAFQRLCELSGFEWFCDEAGKLIFRTATDTTGTEVYTFDEGVDIFSLEYVISDAEVWANVVVAGRDNTGAAVSALADCYQTQYSIPTQKTMYIDAGDIVSTEANCTALATKEAAHIATKSRQVTLTVVGHPWLQVGDCVKINETSTTISQLYRVTEITHNMAADGSPVFSTTIKCYAMDTS